MKVTGYFLIGFLFTITSSTVAFSQHSRYLSFYGGNGETPKSGLIQDAQGNFYGSTYVGGAYDFGEIYQISPNPPSLTVLYSFNPNINDGLRPVGNLVLDQAGNIYGVTDTGGNNACACGSVFELSPPAIPGTPWTETILYAFDTTIGDGFLPEAGLTFDTAGNLYGTTSQGNSGVYELSPPSQPGGAWTETVIASVGGNPQCTLVFDAQGNLYGTAPAGENGGDLGVVFQLVPPSQPGGVWTQNILHNFMGFGDGESPVAGLTLGQGNSVALFGVTSIHNAVSVLFVMFPPPRPGANWIFEVVTDLSENEGQIVAPLVWGGPVTLYGAGTGTGGRIFSVSLANHNPVVTDLYDFQSFSIQGQLLIGNRVMYGTSTIGGKGSCLEGIGCGTVWELTP